MIFVKPGNYALLHHLKQANTPILSLESGGCFDPPSNACLPSPTSNHRRSVAHIHQEISI
jgi:uncharacterized protein (DUF779 family)